VDLAAHPQDIDFHSPSARPRTQAMDVVIAALARDTFTRSLEVESVVPVTNAQLAAVGCGGLLLRLLELTTPDSGQKESSGGEMWMVWSPRTSSQTRFLSSAGRDRSGDMAAFVVWLW